MLKETSKYQPLHTIPLLFDYTFEYVAHSQYN